MWKIEEGDYRYASREARSPPRVPPASRPLAMRALAPTVRSDDITVAVLTFPWLDSYAGDEAKPAA